MPKSIYDGKPVRRQPRCKDIEDGNDHKTESAPKEEAADPQESEGHLIETANERISKHETYLCSGD